MNEKMVTITERCTGLDAVAVARATGLPLCKYSDPISGPALDLDPDSDVVGECLEADPQLLYVDLPAGLEESKD